MKINELCGYAYDCAIQNVYNVLNNIKLETLDLRNTEELEEKAIELNLKFDENGDLLK